MLALRKYVHDQQRAAESSDDEDDAASSRSSPPGGLLTRDAGDLDLEALMRSAVGVFRSRGYAGSVTIARACGLFEESACVRVVASERSVPPWLRAGEPPDKTAAQGAPLLQARSRVGRAFCALLSSLEERAEAWGGGAARAEGEGDAAASADSDRDDTPVELGASATVGLHLPLLGLGWCTRLSLSVDQRALLRWRRRQPCLHSHRDDLPSLRGVVPKGSDAAGPEYAGTACWPTTAATAAPLAMSGRWWAEAEQVRVRVGVRVTVWVGVGVGVRVVGFRYPHEWTRRARVAHT